jgi:hypothetical protein
VIESWWRAWPKSNVGVITGSVSGLVVIDIDPGHGGVDTMRHLVAQHGPLPTGPRVRTGSGGWHLLFAHPGGTVRNSVSRIGSGVDVRGDGGYVIAPPSRHRAGGTYLWTSGGDPPPMPDWLERLVDPPTRQSTTARDPVPLSVAVDRWAEAAMRGEVERVHHAPEGTRNHTLNRAAFSLGQIAGAGLLDPDVIETHLRDAAITVGLGERETMLTIRSGLSAGLEHPREPPQSTNQPHPSSQPRHFDDDVPDIA